MGEDTPDGPDSGRKGAIQWAQSVVGDPRSVVLDCETLGLAADSGLCDIGIVAMDGIVIADWLIDPGRPIPPEASAVHGITDAMVAGCPTFADIWPELRTVLTGRRILVYNAAYDCAIVQGCCEAAGITELVTELGPWECVMRWYGQFDGTPAWKRRGYKWWRLEEACRRFGIDPGGHRARADAEATRRLVIAMSEAEP